MVSKPILRACHSNSAGSWSASRTMTTEASASISHPSQVANASRNGIDTAPGTCCSENAWMGRTSTTTVPSAIRERTWAGWSAGMVSPLTSSGPRRLSSGRRRKYGGKVPNDPSSCSTNAPSSGARSKEFVARSVPIVVVRSAPGGAEQNDPAPWVGHTATPSSSRARRCSDRYWARASSSVRSGDTRSVRAADPTMSEPPVKTPTVVDPSKSSKARCSCVWPGVANVRNVSPPRSTSSPSCRGRCGNSRSPAAEANTVAPSLAASCTAPDRKSA